VASVTAIKQQLKRPDRFSVYLDGKYGFSLSSQQLAGSELASGQILDDDQVALFRQLSEVGKALQAAYNLISYRGRSQKELNDRLGRKGYDETVITAVIDRLVQLKLVDDEDFTRSWVSQTKSATRSRRRLQQELRQKGVEPELVKTQMDEIGEGHDEEAIKTLIERRLNKNTAPDRRKLVEYLARQGFSVGLVLKVLNEEFSEVDWH